MGKKKWNQSFISVIQTFKMIENSLFIPTGYREKMREMKSLESSDILGLPCQKATPLQPMACAP